MNKQINCHGCEHSFTVTRHNQRYCPSCRKARKQAAIDARTVACKVCDVVRYCTYGICEECQAAQDAERRAEYRATMASEKLERRREAEEIYVENFMEKHGPDSDRLTPRQHLALDRALENRRAKLLDNDRHGHHEFFILVCTVAYRRGVLTPARWARMRRMYFRQSVKWCDAVRELYEGITGHPLKESRGGGKGQNSLLGPDLKAALPLLRKLDADPTYAPDDEQAVPPEANALRSFLTALLGERDDEHGGRYGYGATLSNRAVQDAPEATPPEQIAHVNQDAIDAAFAEIMADVDM